MQFADRMKDYEEGIFQSLNEEKEKLIKEGKNVYNLSVGTPDFKPAKHIMDAVIEAAKNPDNYKYALIDIPELVEAVKNHYKTRYFVDLEEDEIMSCYGSQEGITHLGFALCNPNDVVLVPNPGYPIFSIGPSIAGAKLESYPLLPENDYLPDLDKIPKETLQKTKFMIVSYPANPVCATAPKSFYYELVEFAKKHNIIIIHDNAYSDIIYDGQEGISFLSIPGAKEVGVEFYSLSKSYNMTGGRVSFLVGNKEIIKTFRRFRSQIDYGTFLPVQYGAVKALTGPQDEVIAQCMEYQRRRDALCNGLKSIGWEDVKSKGSMFVWAKLPKGYTNSNEFVMKLMEKSGVICTPGSSFGSLGEGYVRFALVLPCNEIEKCIIAIKESGILLDY